MGKEAMTPEQRTAMMRLLGPMMETAESMTVDEIVLAMQGFYATTEENCPWYVWALKWQMPPMLAIVGSQKEGYEQAWRKSVGIPEPIDD